MLCFIFKISCTSCFYRYFGDGESGDHLAYVTRSSKQIQCLGILMQCHIEDEELEADLLVMKKPFEKAEADLRATRAEAVEAREDAKKQTKKKLKPTWMLTELPVMTKCLIKDGTKPGKKRPRRL
ncbi:hypothetical protein U1Q18_001651 [Sarracenia purpurea var. burkii]